MHLLKAEWHECLPSTNSYLIELLSSKGDGTAALAEGMVVAAREQTSGRGRMERKWVSAAGDNLTFSFAFPCDREPRIVVSLPMAIAVAVCEFLQGMEIGAGLKWPNDILVDGRKICGILVEPARCVTGEWLVCGVGLNVNMNTTGAATVDRPVTSVYIEKNNRYKLKVMLDELLPLVEHRVNGWLASGFTSIAEYWTDNCSALGNRTEIISSGRKLSGIVCGFGGFGQMYLRKSDDIIEEIWTGEI